MNFSVAEKAKLLTIVQSPCLSEKAERAASYRQQYVFRVAKAADRPQIKQAVEFLFNVEVIKVRVLNVKGKVKHFKQRVGKRKDWKKAYVSLKQGSHIDFTSI